MSYFVSGLWHFAAAMAFAVAFGAWQNGGPFYYLASPAFTLALMVSSSAFFWVPDRWAKRGLWKFLHYPLPDWDVLLLGPASHRNWLTHSPLLPVLLLAALWKWPQLASPLFYQLSLGAALGVGSHLFWDCVGSKRHSIVVVPYWWTLREVSSRMYLLIGAALCLTLGGVLCGTFETRHQSVAFGWHPLIAFARHALEGL